MKSLIVLLFMTLALTTNAKIYYVSVDGNDSNIGDIDTPFKTIPKAISLIQSGDKIYVRGGTYSYSSTISISKSGTAADTCFLMAYQGERPILDFSGTAFGKRGIILTGSYWYIKGFDVIKAGDNGLNISGGGNSVIEFCSFYENKDTGVQLGNGAHDVTLINCDSYYNADPPDYGDADGFAPKLDVGTNIKFIGCRAWGNCDDGWDGYMRGATDVITILENCWTWGNGYLKDGTNPGSQANGNGFKMGGGDNSNSDHLMHHFYLTNCVAFDNKAKGFDQNNNEGTMSLINCSAYNNASANYRITRDLVEGQTLTVKNCVSYDGNVDLGSFAIQETNSWMSTFSVNETDFVTLDTTGVSGPRQSDGSLPIVGFFHLEDGSDFIDSGTDVGLAYLGSAPDLGAFEFDPNTSSPQLQLNDVKAWFSGDQLNIHLDKKISNPMDCKLYRLNGQLVFQSKINSAEGFSNCAAINRGIYILELTSNTKHFTKKIVK